VPTYEYECDQCGRTFEVRQRISEPPLDRCPSCEGNVRRLLGPALFILKGSGFYVNDYPSNSRKEGQKEEQKTSTSPSPPTPSPSESSPSKA